MNHIDKIGRRYTEVVAEWIAKGYIIDLAFARSGGEISKLDMTNGAEFVQIMVDRFEEWETNLTGVEIVVSKRVDRKSVV